MDWNGIFNKIADVCISIMGRLLVALLIFVVGRFIIKFILKRIKNGKKCCQLDPTVKTFVYNFVKIGLWAVLAVCVVGTLGVEMASIIALLASAGAAVALAVKGSFSNLVSGIMILIFKPIAVGEVVEIGGKMGTVEEVGIFYTKIITLDNLTVSVPNAIMTDSVIVNFSRKDIRRLDIALDVAYGTDIEKAKEIIRNTVAANPAALSDPEPFVRMTAMKDSSIEITLRVWCAKGDFGLLKSDLLEALDKALAAENIEIPFPQLDVHTK